MPEANVLYSVTGAVILGLVVWVAQVLKTAKEPWSRPAPPPSAELESEEASEKPASDEASPKLDADDTARATPVALSEGRQKAAEDENAPKDEKKAAEDAKAEDAPPAEKKADDEKKAESADEKNVESADEKEAKKAEA